MENTTHSFQHDVNDLGEMAVDAAKDAKATVADKATALKEKTQEFGRAAISKIDENRVAAASALRGTASSIHESADKLPNVPDLAHSAARGVDSVANYLESRDTRQFLGDIGSVVKRNPVPSLLVAACAGFLIGRSIRNSG